MIPWRAWWQLARVPNLFTAAADIWGGYLFAGGEGAPWSVPALLTAASVFLYAGGVVLNDVCDADRDATERPGRPIPSGAVSRQKAATVAILLIAVGWLLACLTGTRGAIAASALAAGIVCYDVVAKNTAAAPFVMGICRALNVTLGMIHAPRWPADEHLFAAGLLALYVASLTLFARRETECAGTTGVRMGWMGAAVAAAGLAALPAFMDSSHPAGRIMAGLLMLTVALAGRPAARSGQPADIQRAVKTCILAIIVFDACLAGTTRGWFPAGAILALLAPAVLLGRRFRVT